MDKRRAKRIYVKWFLILEISPLISIVLLAIFGPATFPPSLFKYLVLLLLGGSKLGIMIMTLRFGRALEMKWGAYLLSLSTLLPFMELISAIILLQRYSEQTGVRLGLFLRDRT